MYLPGDEFAFVNERGEEVAYSVVASRDLTDYVKTQIIRLNPSVPIDIPDRVLRQR